MSQQYINTHKPSELVEESFDHRLAPSILSFKDKRENSSQELILQLLTERYQDTATFGILKKEEDGSYSILLEDKARPAVEEWYKSQKLEPISTIKQLPGAFLENGISISETLDKVLKEHNLEYDILEIDNSLVVKPSGGLSTERTLFVNVVINQSPNNGSNNKSAQFKNIDEVFAKCLSGEIQDSRVIISILTFAKKNNIKLKLPEKLQKLFCNILEKASSASTELESRKGLWAKIISSKDNFFHSFKRISSQEKIDEPFLKLVEVITSTNGAKIKRTVAKPKFTRSVTISPIFKTKKEGFKIAVCIEEQRSSVVRDSAIHPIGTLNTPLGIGPISIFQDDIEGYSIKDACNVGLAREAGLVLEDYKEISSGFPAAANLVEKVSNVICTAKENKQTSKELYLLSIHEVIELGLEGKIEDINLLTTAFLLNQYLSEEDLVNKNKDLELEQEYSALINSGSQIFKILRSLGGGFHNLIDDSYFRKLVIGTEQKLGMVIHAFNADNEKEFWEQIFPVVSVSKELDAKNIGEFIHILIHGLEHAIRGGIYPESDFDSYHAQCLKDELEAVYFSDILYPAQIGEETYRRITGRKSLNQVFEELGITELSEKRRIITEIQRDQKISEEILKHQNYKKENRYIILSRLLLRSFLDREHNQIRYNDWSKNPTVLENAKKLSDLNFSSSKKEHDNYINFAKNSIENFPEGENRFINELSNLANFKLSSLYLRFTWLESRFEIKGLKADIDYTLQLYDKTLEIRKDIDTILPTKKNIDKFSQYKEILNHYNLLEKQYAHFFDKIIPTLVDSDLRNKLLRHKDELFPYITPLSNSTEDDIDLARRVLVTEEKLFNAIGSKLSVQHFQENYAYLERGFISWNLYYT